MTVTAQGAESPCKACCVPAIRPGAPSVSPASLDPPFSKPQEAGVLRLLPGRALVHQELQIFTLETSAQPEVLAHMLRVAAQVWMQDIRLGL